MKHRSGHTPCFLINDFEKLTYEKLLHCYLMSGCYLYVSCYTAKQISFLNVVILDGMQICTDIGTDNCDLSAKTKNKKKWFNPLLIHRAW